MGGRRGAGPRPPDRAHRRRLEVGNRIREARLWRNLSQHVLAERVGIDIKTLNRLEVGATDAGLDTVLGISDVLDAPGQRGQELVAFVRPRPSAVRVASNSRDRTLAEVASGSAVTVLQTALKLCNFADDLDIDGEFGPLTEDALEHAQGERGTDPDGIHGPATRLALYRPVHISDGR